jgi:NAD(P)-dependent dehydrogenase (short-subunit alcohol dehydrogenase family)
MRVIVSITIPMASKGVAFVTGASQGIGRAISLRLADDGFDLAINDLPRAQNNLEELSKEIIDKGRRTFVITGDVSVDAEVDAMIASVVESLGSLDVVSTT